MLPEHPLAREQQIRLRQLDGLAFIGFADDIPTRRLVDDRLRAAGARVKMVTTFDNIETIKNLVEIGSGVSLLPIDTVRQEERLGTLAVLPLVAADAFTRAQPGCCSRRRNPDAPPCAPFVEAMSPTKTVKTVVQ